MIFLKLSLSEKLNAFLKLLTANYKNDLQRGENIVRLKNRRLVFRKEGFC